MATSTPALTPPRPARFLNKTTFWLLMGLAALSVLASTEFPILHDTTGPNHDYFLKLIHDRFLLIPHAIAGSLALLSGPLQFSSRIRRKNLQFHRILGRVYVYSVFFAVPCAIAISWGSGLFVGTTVQAAAWFVCTLMALLTARNRQIPAHRQWMVCSYAVTFTFISLRVPNFSQRYAAMSDPHFTLTIIIVTFLSVFLSDIALNWHELTTRRA